MAPLAGHRPRHLVNPIKRFAWIASRHSGAVLRRTVQVWFQAIGFHPETSSTFAFPPRYQTAQTADVPIFNAAGMQNLTSFLDLDPLKESKYKEAILAALQELEERGEVPKQTKYDRYLPWLAVQIATVERIHGKESRSILSERLKKEAQTGRKAVEVHLPHSVVCALGMDRSHRTHRRAYSVWGGPSKRMTVNFSIDEVAYLIKKNRDLDSIMGSSKFYKNAGWGLGEVWEIPDFGAFRLVVEWAMNSRSDLSKYGWFQAKEEALIWDLGRKNLALTIDAVRSGTVKRWVWSDGWFVAELVTDEVMKAEGVVMNFCLDEYDAGRFFHNNGELRVFSLRDPKGLPHATMAWDSETHRVDENHFRGKNNSIPKPEYLARMFQFRRLSAIFGLDRYKWITEGPELEPDGIRMAAIEGVVTGPDLSIFAVRVDDCTDYGRVASMYHKHDLIETYEEREAAIRMDYMDFWLEHVYPHGWPEGEGDEEYSKAESSWESSHYDHMQGVMDDLGDIEIDASGVDTPILTDVSFLLYTVDRIVLDSNFEDEMLYWMDETATVARFPQTNPFSTSTYPEGVFLVGDFTNVPIWKSPPVYEVVAFGVGYPPEDEKQTHQTHEQIKAELLDMAHS